VQAVASGIALGLIYAGIGAGFSLIVATGRLTNLSHGQFVLAGGYVLYVLCDGMGWPWPAGLALTVFVGALLGAALPPLVRRMPDREVNGLALTLGIAFLLQNLLLLTASATYRVIPGGYWLQTVAFGPVVLTRVTLVASGAAAAILVGLQGSRPQWRRQDLASPGDCGEASGRAGSDPLRRSPASSRLRGACPARSGPYVPVSQAVFRLDGWPERRHCGRARGCPRRCGQAPGGF